MKFETKYRILLHKQYFSKGEDLISYGKWFILYFGASTMDFNLTIILGVIYGLISYVMGRIWYSRGFAEADTEVNNRFNLFVKEMRKKLCRI